LPLATVWVCLLSALLLGCSAPGEDSGLPQTMTLTVEVLTPSEVHLDWTPHPGPIVGYDLYRDGVAIFDLHLSGTGVGDAGLAPATRYCYKVIAVEFLQGAVGQSNVACAVTLGIAAWNIETLGSGASPVMVLDAANQPHVSYRDASGIMLAVKAGGAWQQSRVDDQAGFFGDADVQVDRNGANRLSYFDGNANLLKAASDATGAWITEAIDSGGNVNALALDGLGNGHILYNIHQDGTIRYATNSSGAWVSQRLIGFSSGTVYDADILVDSLGTRHAIFVIGDPQDCSIYYLSNPGDGWSEQVIALGSNCGAALAMDASRIPHIAYSTKFGLVHTWLGAGVWQSEQLDSFTWIGGDRVGLAIDGADHLHIAYRDSNDDLKYATNRSGTWERLYLDSRGAVGFSPSIAVDGAGRIHIAYGDEATGTIKLANSP
jgi:hypothetical protein